jgi:hypothetical protein
VTEHGAASAWGRGDDDKLGWRGARGRPTRALVSGDAPGEVAGRDDGGGMASGRRCLVLRAATMVGTGARLGQFTVMRNRHGWNSGAAWERQALAWTNGEENAAGKGLKAWSSGRPAQVASGSVADAACGGLDAFSWPRRGEKKSLYLVSYLYSLACFNIRSIFYNKIDIF